MCVIPIVTGVMQLLTSSDCSYAHLYILYAPARAGIEAAVTELRAAAVSRDVSNMLKDLPVQQRAQILSSLQ